jgi:hypothetical protein
MRSREKKKVNGVNEEMKKSQGQDRKSRKEEKEKIMVWAC